MCGTLLWKKVQEQDQIGPQLKLFWSGHRSVRGERVVMLLTVLLSCLEEGATHSRTHTHSHTYTHTLMGTYENILVHEHKFFHAHHLNKLYT